MWQESYQRTEEAFEERQMGKRSGRSERIEQADDERSALKDWKVCAPRARACRQSPRVHRLRPSRRRPSCTSNGVGGHASRRRSTFHIREYNRRAASYYSLTWRRPSCTTDGVDGRASRRRSIFHRREYMEGVLHFIRARLGVALHARPMIVTVAFRTFGIPLAKPYHVLAREASKSHTHRRALANGLLNGLVGRLCAQRWRCRVPRPFEQGARSLLSACCFSTPLLWERGVLSIHQRSCLYTFFYNLFTVCFQEVMAERQPGLDS